VEIFLCMGLGLIYALINWLILNISSSFLLLLCLWGFGTTATSITLYRTVGYISKNVPSMKLLLLFTAYTVAIVALRLLLHHQTQQMLGSEYRPAPGWYMGVYLFSAYVFGNLLVSPLLSFVFTKFKEIFE